MTVHPIPGAHLSAVIPTLPTKGSIVKKLVIAVLFVASVVLAPVANAVPWSPPVDPTHPVLRWVPKVGPASSQGSVREVRKVRTVRKVGEQR